MSGRSDKPAYDDYDPNHADDNDSGYLSIKPGSGQSEGKDGAYNNNKGTENASGYGGYNDSRGGYNQGGQDSRGSQGGYNDSRGGGGGYNDSRGGGSQGGQDSRGSQGGYNDSRGGGGGYNDRNQGGGGGGGSNDRNQGGGGGGYNDRNQGGYNNESRGGYNDSRGGGGGYNDRNQGGDRGQQQQGSGWFGESEPRDRNQGRYDRNQPSAGGTALPDERGGKPKSRDTIYISGMGSDVTENKLAEFFGKIGIIKADKLGKPKIWLYFDKATGLPKGDATITYEDESTCTNALDWFNNTTFLGKTIAVTRADFYDWEAKKSAGGGRGGRGGRGGGRGRY